MKKHLTNDSKLRRTALIVCLSTLLVCLCPGLCLPSNFSPSCTDDPPGPGDYHLTGTGQAVFICAQGDNNGCCRCQSWTETYQFNYWPYWTFKKNRKDLYLWPGYHCEDDICAPN